MLDLNVRGMFNLIREFLPLLTRDPTNGRRGDDPSRALITASTAGLGLGMTDPFGAYGYSASKAAVIHLARNLAVELGPRGVNVNCICPGLFHTKMSGGLLAAVAEEGLVGGGEEGGGEIVRWRYTGRDAGEVGVSPTYSQSFSNAT